MSMTNHRETQGLEDVVCAAHREWDGFDLHDLATLVVQHGAAGKEINVPDVIARLAAKLLELRVKVIHFFPSRDGLDAPALRSADIRSIAYHLQGELQRIDVEA